MEKEQIKEKRTSVRFRSDDFKLLQECITHAHNDGKIKRHSFSAFVVHMVRAYSKQYLGK